MKVIVNKPLANSLPRDKRAKLIDKSILPAILKYGKLFTKNKSDSYFENILEEVEDLSENETGTMFGKTYVSARKTVQIGNPNIELYNYNSAGSNKLYGWNVSPTIRKIKKRLEEKLGVEFNFVLVNIYNPDAYLGYHSDNETSMVPNSVIASVSLGAERPFLIRNNKTGKIFEILLENGSVCTMEGSFQKQFKHSIPKRKNITGTRINLTFRQMCANAHVG